MQKQIKILLTLLTALILAVSCAKNNPNNPTEDPNIPPDNEWVNNANFTKLQKKWRNKDYRTYTYVITDNKFDSLYNDSVDYSFDIKYIKWSSDTAGIIYGQYTANGDTSVIGKWYAVSFNGLTDSQVSIGGANKQIGTDPDTGWGIFDFSAENLKEAISKFTEANGYFGSYSTCTAVN